MRYPFEAEWFLYVNSSLMFRNSTFYQQDTFAFCVDPRTNSDYFPYSIKRGDFFIIEERVYCAVGTEYLCISLLLFAAK